MSTNTFELVLVACPKSEFTISRRYCSRDKHGPSSSYRSDEPESTHFIVNIVTSDKHLHKYNDNSCYRLYDNFKYIYLIADHKSLLSEEGY